MKNKCIDCGNCCRETEMILSKKDIENIINSPQNNLKEALIETSRKISKRLGYNGKLSKNEN